MRNDYLGEDGVELDSSTFEKQLMELSEVLFNLESEYLDSCIVNGLLDFVRFPDVERSTDEQFSVGQVQIHITHSYAVEGVFEIGY